MRSTYITHRTLTCQERKHPSTTLPRPRGHLTTKVNLQLRTSAEKQRLWHPSLFLELLCCYVSENLLQHPAPNITHEYVGINWTKYPSTLRPDSRSNLESHDSNLSLHGHLQHLGIHHRWQSASYIQTLYDEVTLNSHTDITILPTHLLDSIKSPQVSTSKAPPYRLQTWLQSDPP